MHFVPDNRARLIRQFWRCPRRLRGTRRVTGRPLTAAAEAAVRDVFETECDVFFVTTGTAANALSLSALCPPWGAIYCHDGAHIQNDENTAVELYTGGAKMVAIDGESGNPDPAMMRAHIEIATVHGVHNARPGAICLSNLSESGTVYAQVILLRIGRWPMSIT